MQNENAIRAIVSGARAVRYPGDRGLSPGPLVNGRRLGLVVTDQIAFERYVRDLVEDARTRLTEHGLEGVSVEVVDLYIVVKYDGATIEMGL